MDRTEQVGDCRCFCRACRCGPRLLLPVIQFLKRLRKVTEAHQILLIVDEIQSGLGRVGEWFGCNAASIAPDLLIIGKSLGGGVVSISAVVGAAGLIDLLDQGIESETFAASPFACRLALESIDLICDEQIIANSKRIENHLRIGLDRLAKWISEVGLASAAWDCQGASGWIEIQPRSSLAAQIAYSIVSEARNEGLLVQLSGVDRTRVVLIPPLIAKATEIELAFQKLTKAVSNVAEQSCFD